MPRASTKRQQGQAAANQRDTRHENGLVGPGKRVVKQKSNGHINGHAKSAEPPTPPLPGTPLTNGHVQDHTLADSTMAPKISVEGLRRMPVGGYSESSESESYNSSLLNASSHENHRQIDVNSAKNPAVHRDAGPLSLALTVLRACPLYDTIAILIVLLQLPPTFLSMIHLLFATLTFVPPSNTGGISFVDIFEGSVATPTVATVVVVDVIVIGVWLFLWPPLQDFALDLAQSVIALTLGGAAGGREAGMQNVVVCFGIIVFNHLWSAPNGKQLGLGANISSLAKGYLGSPDADDPLESSSFNTSKRYSGGLFQGIRSFLAMHILAQGGARYIRDWYVRREKRDGSTSAGDPEAGKGLTDTGVDTSSAQTPDNDTSAPLLVTTHSTNAKQRKKQIQQLRTRQPLWAALASTKIVVVKEYETSSAAQQSAGTNATDINNLGNAPFDSEANRIWITFIGPDSVYFATSYFPDHNPEDCEENRTSLSEISKPFYVRVNNTPWQPTRLYTSQSAGELATRDIRWEGEIYGLAPMSSYTCEFISNIDDSLIFSTSVRTGQPQVDASSLAQVASNSKVAGRPSSPTTTLKTSIATSEAKLADERSRQKRERKEQRAKLNAVRKDIEKLNTNISNSGGNDDKLRQKVQQSNLHMKQAEEALETLSNEINALSSLPKEDESKYRSAKKAYQSEKDKQKELRVALEAGKLADDRDLQTLQTEITTLQQKRERMQGRIAKLQGEFERITDANERGINEAQRIANDRRFKMKERAAMEQMLVERLAKLNNDIETVAPVLENLANHVQLLLSAAAEQETYMPQPSPTHSAPNLHYDLPDGNLSPWNPGTNHTSGLYPYAPSFTPPPMNLHASNPLARRRGRSSSMLSDVSGFTEDEFYNSNPQNAPAPPVFKTELRKGSSGSGSASVSCGSGGTGSIGDPKSPTTGNVIVKAQLWPTQDSQGPFWDENPIGK